MICQHFHGCRLCFHIPMRSQSTYVLSTWDSHCTTTCTYRIEKNCKWVSLIIMFILISSLKGQNHQQRFRLFHHHTHHDVHTSNPQSLYHHIQSSERIAHDVLDKEYDHGHLIQFCRTLYKPNPF